MMCFSKWKPKKDEVLVDIWDMETGESKKMTVDEYLKKYGV